MAVLPSDGALCGLLDDELAYDATTATQLSNHLPMALVALDRLGASPARLRDFATRYTRRLVAVSSSDPVATFDEWRAARGRRDAYGSLRAFLDVEVGDLGQEAALRRFLPHLADGISGAAFHGAIRLAYALESRSDARIAAGLAYLTAVHQPLGARSGAQPLTDDPVTALERLAKRRALVTAVGSGNIGERMRQVGGHGDFAGVVDWLAVNDETPRRLTAAAVSLYVVTDDFTALHGVTASHALGVLAPYAEDAEAWTSWWFQALAAAYVTIGAPPLGGAADAVAPWATSPPDWGSIAAAAVASDDEHVSKLVYSARELEGSVDAPLLLGCAARQAGLAPQSAGR